MGGYDKELLRLEIERLEAITPKEHSTERLIGLLRFLEYRLPLDGILEYPTPRGAIFGAGRGKHNDQLAEAIFDVNFRRPSPTWEPTLDAASTKGLPGGDEVISFAGDFHYQAGAITYAAERQLPLLDDGSHIALPFRARYKDNAQSLATLIAVESLGLALPELPLMTAQEVADFRMTNVKELQNFRALMLRHSKNLNAQISDETPIDEIQRKAKFFVESEIAPALHDLKRDLENPNRPWHQRMTEGFKVLGSVAIGHLSGGLVGKTAAEGVQNAILAELKGKGEKLEAAKRNGLYYLLRARAVRS